MLLQQPPKDERGYSRNVEAESRKEVVQRLKETRELGKEPELVTTSRHLDIPIIPDSARLGFDVRAFCKEYGLSLNANWKTRDTGARKGSWGGGAVHMFRQVWDESVGGIYEVFFGKQEPRYGLPPKYDPYKELKGRRKYVLQGQGQGQENKV